MPKYPGGYLKIEDGTQWPATRNKIAATYVGNGIIVHIRKSVAGTWRSHRQKKASSLEACGILIATFDMDYTRVWMETATAPQRQDKRHRYSFSMNDPRHQSILVQQHKRFHGQRFLLGTWHTHPEKNPSPSSDDFSGWENIVAANPHLPVFCFAIVGTKTNSIFLHTKTGFNSLKQLT